MVFANIDARSLWRAVDSYFKEMIESLVATQRDLWMDLSDYNEDTIRGLRYLFRKYSNRVENIDLGLLTDDIIQANEELMRQVIEAFPKLRSSFFGKWATINKLTVRLHNLEEITLDLQLYGWEHWLIKALPNGSAKLRSLVLDVDSSDFSFGHDGTCDTIRKLTSGVNNRWVDIYVDYTYASTFGFNIHSDRICLKELKLIVQHLEPSNAMEHYSVIGPWSFLRKLKDENFEFDIERLMIVENPRSNKIRKYNFSGFSSLESVLMEVKPENMDWIIKNIPRINRDTQSIELIFKDEGSAQFIARLAEHSNKRLMVDLTIDCEPPILLPLEVDEMARRYQYLTICIANKAKKAWIDHYYASIRTELGLTKPWNVRYLYGAQ